MPASRESLNHTQDANGNWLPSSSANPLPLPGIDSPSGRIGTNTWVWDTNALAWVKQTSGGGGPTSNVNVTNVSIPVTQSGTWSNTATQSNGANLHVNVDNFPSSQVVTFSGDVAISPIGINTIQAAGPATATPQPLTPGTEIIDGSIIVPPGGVLAVMNQVATTTISVNSGLVWIEQPL